MPPTSFSDCKIAIVGLGLMGGSLALALKAAGHRGELIGVARRQTTLDEARKLSAIDIGSTELHAVANADIVILATPVRTILEQIYSVGPHMKPGAVLLDLGSTKQIVCEALAKTPPHVQPLGGHPMCGKETSGLDVAEANLYRNKTFVLCPLDRTTKTSLAHGLALIESIGARPLVLDPVLHDQLVAMISHLPYLLAAALTNTVADAGKIDSRVWEVAASGFRDTSRLAGSDPTMMLDILLTNRVAIQHALREFGAQLQTLAAELELENENALREKLLEAQHARQNVAANLALKETQ